MSSPTENTRRIAQGRAAVTRIDGDSFQEQLTDLLTDLRHFAASELSTDFDAADRMAAGHFAIERGETGGPVPPAGLPDPPPDLADAWRRYQSTDGGVTTTELSELDEWRAECAEAAGF